MEIKEISEDGNILKVVASTNEESLFMLLKAYLEQNKDVDVVGIYKGHHLIDETELHLKTKKGSASKVFKEALKVSKKDLNSRRLK